VALDFTKRTLRNSMAQWVTRSIKGQLWLILAKAEELHRVVDLQDIFLRITFDNICSLEFGKDLETLSPSLPLNPFATAFDNATEATLQHFVFPQVIWRISKIMGCGMDVELHQSVSKVKKYLSEINTIITLIRLGFSI
jgi:hypothetical protein